MRRHILIVVSLLALSGALAAPAFGHEVSPEDTRPVVMSARLEPPQGYNAILEADLSIAASDDEGVVGYEYRWIGTTMGRVYTADVDAPTVSYRTIRPDSAYGLLVRAVDSSGQRSGWFSAWSGITPPPPNVIVAGDSIASGYTRRWFTSSGTCRDAEVSYGSTVRDHLASSLPAQWDPGYANVAWAGAGVHAMAGGGIDSCGMPHGSQLDAIAALADGTTWNIVVVTAGINSTNWSSVIVDLTKNTAFSLTERGDKEWCEVSVSERWNIGERAVGITTAVRRISSRLRAETNADVYWTSYYPITGSKLAPWWTPVGAECDDEMSGALDRLHGAIEAGLHSSVTWVDIGASSVSTQQWAGWPHPNPDGQRVIGERVAAAIG